MITNICVQCLTCHTTQWWLLWNHFWAIDSTYYNTVTQCFPYMKDFLSSHTEHGRTLCSELSSFTLVERLKTMRSGYRWSVKLAHPRLGNPLTDVQAHSSKCRLTHEDTAESLLYYANHFMYRGTCVLASVGTEVTVTSDENHTWSQTCWTKP